MSRLAAEQGAPIYLSVGASTLWRARSGRSARVPRLVVEEVPAHDSDSSTDDSFNANDLMLEAEQRLSVKVAKQEMRASLESMVRTRGSLALEVQQPVWLPADAPMARGAAGRPRGAARLHARAHAEQPLPAAGGDQ